MVGAWYFSRAATDKAKGKEKAYGKAGGIANESISELRTVAALGAEVQQAELYKGNLAAYEKVAYDSAWKGGLANGMMFGNADLMAAVGFLYGGYMIVQDKRDNFKEFTVNGTT